MLINVLTFWLEFWSLSLFILLNLALSTIAAIQILYYDEPKQSDYVRMKWL